MFYLYPLLYISSAFLLIAVVLPLVHSSFWIFRVFEYPRFQKLTLISIVFTAWLFTRPWNNTVHLVIVSVLFLAIIYLLYKIIPYTPLSKLEMKASPKNQEGCTVKFFSANVLQDNTNYKGYIALINKVDPDVIFLLETDEGWDKGLQPLREKYPYEIKKVLNNTYGMILYSRLHIIKSNIHFLADKEVPSFHLLLQLPNKDVIQFWGLHPKPPLPNESLRSDAKDKELMKVAFKVRNTKLPVIVMGDLNDVAWSHTTELFRKTSELLDPRRGRGFYSTFNAKHWFMRFPLDYIFASTHFSLVNMKRLPPTGSDHFPIITELHYSQVDKSKQEKPEADAEELSDAAEISAKPV
jgi:endonuclease/exonuclease/phosphatase (EEP) superfamily protein YafD